MLKVTCSRSKKSGNLYYALVNCSTQKDVFCCFDPVTISKITGLSIREIYLLDEGESILFTLERS